MIIIDKKKLKIYVAFVIHNPSPKRFELLRGNPMYLAGTRLNHSAKATFSENPHSGAAQAR
jgi:hypothetical protein